jgi:cytoskeletal protein RodZ
LAKGYFVGRFGENLRRERELREITLEEIAAATKIGTRSLRALEEERFGQLPGGIFNRGFVRAYARYVGIDEDEAVLDFVEAAKEAENEAKELNSISVIAKQVESSRARERGRHGVLAFAWTLVVVLFVGGATVAGWPYLEKWRANRAQLAQGKIVAQLQQVQAATAPKVASSAQPVADSATAAVAPAANDLLLAITVKQRCWVEVRGDGKLLLHRAMDPGSDPSALTFTARERLVLVTGNPHGVELTFNGRPFKPTGPFNVPRTLTFTAGGVQQD